VIDVGKLMCRFLNISDFVLAESEALLSAIHKLINSVWNKVELPDQWKIITVHKKGDKPD
jgi:hypothetical protein